MKLFGIVVAVVGVCAAFFALFVVTDAVHRLRRRAVRAVDALRRRALSLSEDVPTALRPEQAIERLAGAFAARSPVVPHRTDRELVLFWGTGGGLTQFKGIAAMRAEDMPLRLAAQARDGAVRVLIDEDFGFHLFFGPAREIFQRLYRDALDKALAHARQALLAAPMVLAALLLSTPASTNAQAPLLQETFDDNRRGWRVGSDEAGEATLEAGRYRISSRKEGFYFNSAVPVAIDPFADFSIEASFRELSARSPKTGYGLSWGASVRDRHVFYITSSGRYTYGMVVGGRWTGARSDFSSRILKAGVNRLGVRRVAGRVEYSINGSVVARGTYEERFGNLVGFSIGAGRDVEIDDLTVTQSLSAAAEAKSTSRRHFSRGRALVMGGKPAEGLEDLERAIALDPTLDAAYYLKGMALASLRRLDEAIAAFDRVIELRPSAPAYAARAQAYSARAGRTPAGKEDLARARDDFDQAVKLEARSAPLWSAKAGIHFRLGEVEAGCRAADSACKLGSCALLREFEECRDVTPAR